MTTQIDAPAGNAEVPLEEHPIFAQEQLDDIATTSPIDALVAKAQAALTEYAAFTQEQIDHIVRKASVAALHNHGRLAVLAVEETKRGVFEDKAVKNIFACEHVTNSIINQKTVGVISHDELHGHHGDRRPGRGHLCADPRHQPHLDHHLQGADRAEDA